ncbi:MAG: hypothetical protein AAGF11_52580 [Myxococcota bacterium]
MFRAHSLVRSLSFATLGLLLAAGCGGESKPAAKSPAPEASASAASADKAEPASKASAAHKGAAAPDKVKVVEGAAPGGDDRYALHIEPPAESSTGQQAEVVVRVVPKEPWHMNLDFPTSLKVTPPTGLSLASADLKKGDARKLDDSTCEFAVQFTPKEAGEHTVTGKFKFAVCQDEACSPVTEDVEFKVAVK